MNKDSTRKIPTNNTTEPKKIITEKFLKKRGVIILVLAIISITTLTFSIFLLYRNNVLNKQLDELANTAKFDSAGNKAEAVLSPTPYKLPENVESRICGIENEECLFKQGSGYYGYATLEGYYKKYDGTQWEWSNRKVDCDSLVTTGGSEELINEFKNSAQRGNTLNKFIDDKFHININLTELSLENKTLIQKSSPDRPIEIGVIRRFGLDGGAPTTCYSLVDIISVKLGSE